MGKDVWPKNYEGETRGFLNSQEATTAFGLLWVDKAGIALRFDGTDGVVIQPDRTESGDLTGSENGGLFFSVDSIQSSVLYLTHSGLAVNATVDQGVFLLENSSAGCEGDTGVGYTPGNCCWKVIKSYDQTQDDIRETQVKAICYVPRPSMGVSAGKPECGLYHRLYDSYTGKWSTRISEYGISSRGKDYYLHTVKWSGQNGIIEFTRSTDWQSDADE